MNLVDHVLMTKAFYHSFQNTLFSLLISKNATLKYITLLFSVHMGVKLILSFVFTYIIGG
jgi:hypothetical protein